MATTLSSDVLEDPIATSLARALAAANRRAREAGVDTEQSMISVAQHASPQGLLWRVNYGPREYVNRRGGDLVVEVDADSGSVLRVLRGQ
jgi:hypothetical protein